MPGVVAALLAGALLNACAARDNGPAAAPRSGPRPVVVQGAMDIEILKLAGAIDNAREETVQGWTFWSGTVDGYPVVISKTLRGMENAAAATAIAAERYHPAAIINQGTAGGHVPDLHVYDIVLGTESINLGTFKTAFRARGRGSRFSEWTPIDQLRPEGSAGRAPAPSIRRFRGDEGLLSAAHSVRGTYAKGRIVDGVIGSSGMWNSEIDRIQFFHDRFGTAAEEMETASVAQISGLYEIPFLGIRVLSNNITNEGTYDARTGEACQAFVFEVVKAYLPTARAASPR